MQKGELMKLIQTVSNNELQEIQQTLLSYGISLRPHDISQLIQYQTKICDQLDWVETDSMKLQQIIQPFLQTNLIHTADILIVLKKIIQSYYIIRSKGNDSLSDERICQRLSQEYQKYEGLNLETLAKRTMQRIIKEEKANE